MQTLHLDDRKVLRRFGTRPELGRVIGGVSPTTKAIISSPTQVFTKVEYTTEVTVRCVVSLKCVGKGKWKALCQERHRSYVEWWLVTHCGYSKVSYDY